MNELRTYEEYRIAPNSYTIATPASGTYRVVGKYALKPDQFSVTDIFTFQPETIRQTIVGGSTVSALAGEFPPLDISRSVYIVPD
jgi:hypothetical protein